jgi:hypothetical protein
LTKNFFKALDDIKAKEGAMWLCKKKIFLKKIRMIWIKNCVKKKDFFII